MRCSKLVAWLTSVLICVSAHADTITLAADQWCPYNCTPNTSQEGYMVDIARAVFEKAGHKVVYQNSSWADALADARAGKITGVVGAVPEEVSDFVIPKQWQGFTQDHFYVLAKNTWRYHDVNSLAKVKAGFIKDYAYNTTLFAFIQAHQHSPDVHIATGEHGLEDNINMVMNKQLDTLIEDHNVFKLTAQKMKVLDQFTDAGASGVESPVCIAFSPQNPKSHEYAELLSAGMTQLRNSGELQKIMARYGLTDWGAQ